MSRANASILWSGGLLRAASPTMAAHNSEIPYTGAAGSAAVLFVTESQDPVELIDPCPSVAGCAPNQAISIYKGSSPTYGCTNDVNGGGRSYQKVCTSVGTGTTDAIPFPCSAGKVLTFVAAASGTLTVQRSFAVDAGLVFLATGDFNGDGRGVTRCGLGKPRWQSGLLDTEMAEYRELGRQDQVDFYMLAHDKLPPALKVVTARGANPPELRARSVTAR
jgi:hypothetical protein